MDRRQHRQEQTQNQNRRRENRVRGPTSALSSFLQEHGIRVENRSRRRIVQHQQERSHVQHAVETSMQEEQVQTETVTETRTAERSSQVQETTSILYMPETTAESTPSRQRRTRSAAASNVIARASKGKKRRKGKCESDESDNSEDEDSNDAGTSSSRQPPEPRTRIAFCTKCNNRFSHLLDRNRNSEAAQLCPSCLSGNSAAAGPKPDRNPRAKKRRFRAVPSSGGIVQVLSLQDICINMIAKYIDEVEEFGEIGTENLDKIAKIISRNRKLNNQTVRLFLGPMLRELSLYDCAYVDRHALMNIGHFCFNLRQLKLIYCGDMTSEVLDTYSARLQHLRSVEFSGPYLVLEDSWIKFIKSLGVRLERFVLSHCFRFNTACMEALTEHCPNLQALELSHISKLNDAWLDIIGKFKHLKVLKVAWPAEGVPIAPKSVIHLLSKVGHQLTELSLPGCTEINDDVLLKGILEHCPHLKVLNLEECDAVSSEGMESLFTSWKLAHPTSGLEQLNVSRCRRLEDGAIKAILAHSARTLTYLNLHSVNHLTAGGLEMIAGKYEKDKEGEPCRRLKSLNVSFVRAMDDFVLKRLSTHCPELKSLEVWGCPQLTGQITLPPALQIHGRESNE
ncbi:hypothetical protein BX666DRAFT_1921454 [Dichotomocladium elegans]|nr:hypothetical protein BX666DRAFT_1921454 [Dichotomocladium elegans]